MIEYETISYTVDDYNDTARKIRLKTSVELAEYGEISEAVIVNSEGFGQKVALFIKDDFFIEGLTEESLFWRLAEISENLEIRVDEKKK